MSFLDVLLGKRLASSEEETQKIGVAAGVAVLGLDGLSSAAYGPEAALTLLLPLGVLGLNYIGPIIVAILFLLVILYFSYLQTIAAYPTGGGSYTVAKENLGVSAGLAAAAALMIDYILNVAVGIAAGIGALVSALPVLHPYILPLCLLTLAVITLINLRGVREAGVAFMIPTYLFVASLGIMLVIGLFKTITGGGHPVPAEPIAALPPAAEAVGIWLLLRAFANGCTAMTGVEAVSNGISAFAEPAVPNARKTLTTIVVILGVLLAGIAYLAHAYGIGAIDPTKPEYESIISQLLRAVFGRNFFYYVSIGSTLLVLSLSANTSFAGFPRLCRLLALDAFLPTFFAHRGRRLVYTGGIAILTLLSAVLLIIFGGITDRLIPLFAVGAFTAFTLSQAGMVVHWQRMKGKGHRASLGTNALGCALTIVALGIILVTKFVEGAWVPLLMIPSLLILFLRIKKHYDGVAEETKTDTPLDLDTLQPPIIVVPVLNWNTIVVNGLRFAVSLSPDVQAVHINTDEEVAGNLRQQWARYAEEPARHAHRAVPELVFLPSPYRRLFTPFLAHIDTLKRDNPQRTIAVVIPELVETHWYQYLLHNQRATGLKTALLFRGGKQVVVINVPWFLSEHCA